MSEGRYDVVVVGAGVAGLVASVEVARSGARTLVLDAHRPGGRARTTDRDGFLFNEGPHALYEAGPFMAALKRWGLEPPGRRPPAARAHVAVGDSLHPLPAGAARLARTPLLRPAGRVRFARLMAGLSRLDVTRLAGRTVDQWCEDEDLPADVRALLLLLIRVTSYSNAPDLMDAAAAALQLRAGLQGVRYVDGGWQRIIDGLAGALAAAGGTLHAGTAVGAIESNETVSDGVTLRTHAAYGPVESAAVILAGLPPAEAGRLLGQGTAPFGDLGPAVEAACLELGVTRPADPPVVFGLDRPLYLSVHAPVARLAPPGRAIVEVMHYLPPGYDGDAAADRGELEELARRCGIDDGCVEQARFLRRVTVAHALPLARTGGLAGRPAVTAAAVPNVFLAGDWVGPEGMLSDASAASGLAAARAALQTMTTEVATVTGTVAAG